VAEKLVLTDFSVAVAHDAKDPHDTHRPVTVNTTDTVGALTLGPTVDPELMQIRMVPGGNGTIYSQQADGRLLWFRHTGWQTGAATWASGSGRLIGTDWHTLTNILAAADGQLFGFCGDGTVRWHKYVVTDSNTGAGSWAANTSAVIGQNFDRFSYVFGGWNGVIYAEDNDGNLWWFKYLAGNGTNGAGAWANNGQGALIGTYNKWFTLRWADADGVIYGVRQGAVLTWYRYLAGDGTNGPGAWANNGQGIDIGEGWDWDSSVERFASSGAFYTVFANRDRPAGKDHELHWYKLNNWQNVNTTGTASWAANSGGLIGTDWTVSRSGALHGHADRWTAKAGTAANFAVSTTFSQFQATALRLDGPLTNGAADDLDNSTVVWGPTTVPGRLQLVQPGYRTNGTGWLTDFSITPQASWKSGFHVVKITGPNGLRRYIPFVVRPATPTANIAVMLPFLTHNAYNYWGGHNQYTWDNIHPLPQTVSHRRPFANVTVEPPGIIDAHFYSDLRLLRWMADNNVPYDCYQDTDLHNDDTWLSHYKAVVLGSHPEYWSPTMRARLLTYLGNGGRLIYLGGNGIYERVDLSANGSASIHRNNPADPGARWLFRNQAQREDEILGVAYDEVNGYMSFAPYGVVNNHPFLAGTGLVPGDEFGASGFNLGASGWEIDRIYTQRAGLTLIAKGTQSDGVEAVGANMIHWDRGNGGWVFAVSSLCFNGSLSDPAISQIMRNVFTAAQATP
jgi:N,N-dimethylformamidase